MKKSLIEIAAFFLGFSVNEVVDLSRKAPLSYFRFEIPKKNGGMRAIFHPSKETKALQYALIETLLRNLKVHSSAIAYIPGKKSPLKINALMHCPYKYSVRIDFQNFFPSIRPNDLVPIIEQEYGALSSQEIDFLSNSLFVRFKGGSKGLAIGAPSSPWICNIIMNKLDEEIKRVANQLSSDSIYTRYADDLVFSTNVRGVCREFAMQVKLLLQRTQSPMLKINLQKTVFLSRKNKRMVTGIILDSAGAISLGRNNKRYVRKLIFEYKNQKITPEQKIYLRGYLGFSRDIEPDFYNRLAIKYGVDLLHEIIRN